MIGQFFTCQTFDDMGCNQRLGVARIFVGGGSKNLGAGFTLPGAGGGHNFTRGCNFAIYNFGLSDST